MRLNTRLRAALTAADEDQIVYDITGIEDTYDALTGELPGVRVRFAMKACPVGAVLEALSGRGAGFDTAGPNEIAQALAAGAPASEIHYGNTVKSDRDIADAHRLGVRDFATDSVEDVVAIAAGAPGSRVFCRLATAGTGALWGLSRKNGCSAADAVRVLETARASGLTPSGLSVHVGSQQMTARAWQDAFDTLAWVLTELRHRAIHLDHVNLGGGLPALGYHDLGGVALHPPMDEIFSAIRAGMRRLRAIAPIGFVIEPGRHLVADHGAVRAHVVRLTTRRQLTGDTESWLYLSCGKFNGLYEMDQVQYRLVFPGHLGGDQVAAYVAGPTCDSDDTFSKGRARILVPRAVTSGDPVWILSSGAYSTSYTTLGFNGFAPLPVRFARDGARCPVDV
ncbi:ornithine decarboxylase [Lentzea aerocolonigenes]|uniref:ornithine decarboxylase n=1 Tax=Lentzea aerocolonigenes TaxID=68170 RepID=A0A0F0HA16_LENAE|nr:ornithine decarboxylase [Lentzea aerocolonigenes]KJK51701.1 ornithine decarboxylase [Lentzea aerocolonigenes]